MPNKCGSCSMCCKLTVVHELSKPENKWCRFCRPGKGCEIYEDRPESCKEFKCFWLAESWPDNLRPDRCRVMFEPLYNVMTILAMVEPSRPQAWRTKTIGEVINKLVKKDRPVVVCCSLKERYMFLPPGTSKEDVITDVKEALRIRNGCS